MEHITNRSLHAIMQTDCGSTQSKLNDLTEMLPVALCEMHIDKKLANIMASVSTSSPQAASLIASLPTRRGRNQIATEMLAEFGGSRAGDVRVLADN